MKFDLRTCGSARYFILDFMKMNIGEIRKLIINSENDFETFWQRNIDIIKDVDISNLRIMAFHVLGALDDCKEIKENGLMNLQAVLAGNTIMSSLLKKSGICFDIKNRTVSYNGKVYDIDYEHYRHKNFLTKIEEALDKVAHRVFYDFCVNGFLLNDDVLNYGTDIHERPEFLMTLAELFPEAEKLECYWKCHAKSYRIDFYATIDQIHRFNFELDEWRDPPYKDWNKLDDEMKIKKWMLSHAIDRVHNRLGDIYLYIRDDVIIPPNQIIDYTEI